MATITKAKILWKRTKSLLGHLMLWRKASLAFDQPLDPASPVELFQDGEEIPLKGFVWVVGKRVGGPLPVLLLTPVEQTSRARKSADARATRNAKRVAFEKQEMLRLVRSERRRR